MPLSSSRGGSSRSSFSPSSASSGISRGVGGGSRSYTRTSGGGSSGLRSTGSSSRTYRGPNLSPNYRSDRSYYYRGQRYPIYVRPWGGYRYWYTYRGMPYPLIYNVHTGYYTPVSGYDPYVYENPLTTFFKIIFGLFIAGIVITAIIWILDWSLYPFSTALTNMNESAQAGLGISLGVIGISSIGGGIVIHRAKKENECLNIGGEYEKGICFVPEEIPSFDIDEEMCINEGGEWDGTMGVCHFQP